MKGLSQLFRDTDIFLAGSTEQGFKRNLSNPSSLSSNGHSASPPQRTRLQKSRKKPREEPSGMCLKAGQLCLNYYYNNNQSNRLISLDVYLFVHSSQGVGSFNIDCFTCNNNWAVDVCWSWLNISASWIQIMNWKLM